jgi:hypothetical protein
VSTREAAEPAAAIELEVVAALVVALVLAAEAAVAAVVAVDAEDAGKEADTEAVRAAEPCAEMLPAAASSRLAAVAAVPSARLSRLRQGEDSAKGGTPGPSELGNMPPAKDWIKGGAGLDLE